MHIKIFVLKNYIMCSFKHTYLPVKNKQRKPYKTFQIYIKQYSDKKLLPIYSMRLKTKTCNEFVKFRSDLSNARHDQQ